MRFDWRTVRFALFVSSLMGVAASQGYAAPVTWEFTGSITSVAPFATGQFTVGDVATYKLTTDSSLQEVAQDVDDPDFGQYLIVGQPLSRFDFEATIGDFRYFYSGSFVSVTVDRDQPQIIVDTSLTGVAVDGPAQPFDPGGFGSTAPLWHPNALDFSVSFTGASPWATDELGQLLPSSPFTAGLSLGFCPYCDLSDFSVPVVNVAFTSARQIPEPASLAILLLGAGGAALVERKRRRRSEARTNG
jgi:hypothetical protein